MTTLLPALRLPKHHRPAPERPVASKWLIFAIVSMALMMGSIDSTIVATAIPTLRHALHAQINWASWTLTAYQLGLVVALPVAGRVSDQLGRKRVFVGAATLFTTASLFCGLSDSIGVLVALRVVQAAGGAAFLPAASGMVVDAFGESRNRALGLFSSIFPTGAMIGPVIGGIIISDWSWRGIFLVNVPIGVAFTLLAVRYLPSSKPLGGRADLVGAALLGASILSLMLCASRLGDAGVTLFSPSAVAPFASAVACGWLFVWRSKRVAEPIIPLELLKGRAFAAMNIMNLVWGACVVGFGALVPLFAEERYGLSPLSSGTLLTARAVGEIGMAILAAMLIYRTGYRAPMVVGFLLVASGLSLLVLHPLLLGPYGWMAAAAALTGLGTGLSAPAANNASLELAPHYVGAVTGLRGACRQAGSIIGVAIATAFVARSSHEAATLGHAFLVFAALLACIVPMIFLVPDVASRRPGARQASRGTSRPAASSRTRAQDG